MLSDSDLAERFAPWYDDRPEVEVPPVPAWLTEDLPLSALVEPGCDCPSCACLAEPVVPAPRAEEPVRWATPGVTWDDEPAAAVLPPVGPGVLRLQEATAALAEVDPTALPGPLALVEAEVLQRVEQQLRVLLLPRVADVKARKLFALAGFHSVSGWQRHVAPDADSGDRTLASRLGELPVLEAAVRDGRVSLDGASRVGAALSKVRRHLDQSDGLIDGQPGEGVVAAVLGNTVDLICQGLGGLDDDDPRLHALTERVATLQEAGGSQHGRVEAAFTLLAEHLVVGKTLSHALEQQVFAVVPNLLEAQLQAADAKRHASLRRHPDGSWELAGRLTPECGERLFTALAAEARRDPANPVDTLARQHLREQALRDAGLDPFADGTLGDLPRWEREALAETHFQPGPEHEAQVADFQALGLDEQQAQEAALLVPRSRSRRLHDALHGLLARYLDTGLGGTHDKVPVQLTATLPSSLIEQQPGALPGKSGSGRPLARSVLQRWWGDAQVTTLLLSRGWKPLGQAHSGRTATGTERLAVRTQWDNRCPGADCCPGTPDPLLPLVAHHVRKHSQTGHTVLEETLLICDRLHADLHLGKKTVRLRDGRLLTEDGWITHG